MFLAEIELISDVNIRFEQSSNKLVILLAASHHWNHFAGLDQSDQIFNVFFNAFICW